MIFFAHHYSLMKSALKFSAFVTVAFLILSTASGCGKKRKKDWECTCLITDTTQMQVSNASRFIERFTRSQADDSCSSYGKHISAGFPMSSYNCSVK